MKRNEAIIPREELYLYSQVNEADISISGLVTVAASCLPDPEYKGLPIFIVGPHGGGKSTIAHASLDPELYRLFDTGPILRSYHAQDDPHLKFSGWVSAREEEYGPAFTDDLLAAHIIGALALNRTTPRTPVILGNRSMKGVDRLTSALRAPSRRLIYITAGETVLYERMQSREARAIKPKKFAKLLHKDIDTGIGLLEEMADYVIRNDGTLEGAVTALRHAVTIA